MSTPVQIDDDYGYLTFEFAPPPGADPVEPVRADLYAVNAAYLQSYKDAPGDPWPLFVSRLAGQGFPTLSHMNAERVERAVQAEINRLGKADAGSGSAG